MAREKDPTILHAGEPWQRVADKELAHSMAIPMDVPERMAANADRKERPDLAGALRTMAHYKGEQVRVNHGRQFRGTVSYQLPDEFNHIDRVAKILDAHGGKYSRTGQLAAYNARFSLLDQHVADILAVTGASELTETEPKLPDHVGRSDAATYEAAADFGLIIRRVVSSVPENLFHGHNGFDKVEIFSVDAHDPLAREKAEVAANRKEIFEIDDYKKSLYERAVGETDGASLRYIPVTSDPRITRMSEDPLHHFQGLYSRDSSSMMSPNVHIDKDRTPVSLSGDRDAIYAVEMQVAHYEAMLEGRLETPEELTGFIQAARQQKAEIEARKHLREEAEEEERRQRLNS